MIAFINRFAARSNIQSAWDQYRAEKEGYDHVMRTNQPEPPIDYDELQRELEKSGTRFPETSPGWTRLQLDVHPDVLEDLDLVGRRLGLGRGETIQKALDLLKVLSTRRTYTALDQIKIHDIR